MPLFRPIPADLDLVAIEVATLARWDEHRIFPRSVEQRAQAPEWVFFEGPPTANGQPGLHHAWARVYKDLFCRYRTMRGYRVERRAGWDTHGLPVEVEVEKALGVSTKREIEEDVGIAEFIARCRESVLRYVDQFKDLTHRIGYWVDLDAAYWTFDPDYVQSVWWHLSQLFDKGLLYEGLKVVPYCPRCGTALSSHELGQPGVYQEVEDESAYVLFPLVGPPGRPPEGGGSSERRGSPVAPEAAPPDPSTLPGNPRFLVAWTTTPWTLLSNTGLAVNPELTYAVVDGMVVADELVKEVFGEDAPVSAHLPGTDLVGLRYERLFDDVPVSPDADADGWRVVPADFVTIDEGTGIVHLAPAFGEADRQAGRASGLPALNPVDAGGRFTQEVPWLAGQAVRDTSPAVDDQLEARGLLLRRHPYRHSYPHCWRCGTPLIYWGKPSWYVATSSHKDDLVAANQTIEWHPSYIRDGRFGEWLANNVDWALSRDRYWGTPLPVWRCPEGHVRCVASLVELSELAGRDVTHVDPHRPDIDAVTFPCPDCAPVGADASSAPAGVAAGDAAGGDALAGVNGASAPAGADTQAGGDMGADDRPLMARVAPVIDAWFDSGSMPAAQVGYPAVPGSVDALRFPADFIAEAIDQTRGWFYSLLAVNTLVFGGSPYRHVLCLGHIVDADGRKMSKSLGNVMDPWEVLDSRGADALRWWMFSQGSPWTPTRSSLEVIDTALRDTLLTFWHTLSFFTTYASLNGFDPEASGIPVPADRPHLDRWVLSRLAGTIQEVTTALDEYEPLAAANALSALVDDVSNWYVRRSRRRFWRTDPSAPPEDSLAAQATLHTVLVETARLLAPFCPFLADHAWHALTGAGEDDSVHLADWALPAHVSPDAASQLDHAPAPAPAAAADERSRLGPVAPGVAAAPANRTGHPTHPAHGHDADLEAQMAQARRLASLGRAARSEAGVKVRQPLSRALVLLPPGAPPPLEGVVEEELNVDRVEVAQELGAVLSYVLVPNFRLLGPRLGKAVQELRAALGSLDTAGAAQTLERGEDLVVDLPSGPVRLSPEEVELRVQGQPGFAVSREGGEVVALDLELDDDLRRRGWVREVVRQVQDLRKASGLDVSDRIHLRLHGLDVLTDRFDEIGQEVLASSVEVGQGEGPGTELQLDEYPTEPRAWLTKA